MDERDEGLRILSLDGGGPGCFSQLVILDEYGSRIAHDKQIPKKDVQFADYFDLIGGVGFGAYIAVMLGVIRMTIQEAMKELHTLGTKITAGMPQSELDSKQRLELLKEGIKEMLKRHDIPEGVSLQDQCISSTCKVAILAASTSALNSCQWFRTYPSRHDELECPIIEALSASMAMPTIFAPASVGPDYAPEEFIGAGFGFNNPTRELLKEARSEYGSEQRVSLILSLGSGLPKELSLERSISDPNDISETMEKLTISGQSVENEVSYQLHDTGAYIRLNVDQGLDNIPFYDWNQLGKIRSHTRRYVQSTSVSKLVDVSITALDTRHGLISLSQMTRSTRIKRQAKSPPAVSIYFVVRKGWEIMEDQLTGTRQEGLNVFVITGMGGSGKTQMVSYFVQKHGSRFKHIFFIDASSKSSIKTELQSAIQSIDGYQQGTDIDALSFLTNQPDSLLIFDNADDPAVDVVPFFPRSYRGIIVITSRLRDTGELATLHHLQLGSMTREEAMETLAKSSRRTFPLAAQDIPHTEALIDELGGLALALVQAGIYISKMGDSNETDEYFSPFEQYLNLFKRERAMLMRKEGTTSLDQYKRGVYPTLDLSYSLLPSQVQSFLHLCSQFHHTNISLAMVLAAAERDFMDTFLYSRRPESHYWIQQQLRDLLCPYEEGSEFHIREMIHCLSSFSLVQVIGARDTIVLRFHPLVHGWASETLSSETVSHTRKLAITVLSSSEMALSPSHKRYLPQHILTFLEKEVKEALHVNDKLVFGCILREHWMGNIAEELHESAVEDLEEELGAQSLYTIYGYDILSSTYRHTGKLEEAEQLLTKALDFLQQNFGEKHYDTLVSASKLGNIFLDRGKLHEAEKLQLKVLKTQQEILGEEHLNTVEVTASLACIYLQLGKTREAEDLEVRVLALDQKILGEQHPATITASSNLADTYLKLGKLKEAEELQLKVVAMRRNVFGEGHPETIYAYGALAAIYLALGRPQEAEELEIDVLKMCLETLGERHPYTIRATSNLADTYLHLGKINEAEELQTKVLRLRREILGEQHIDTIRALGNLAAIYGHLNKCQEAEEIETEVLQIRLDSLGEQHPLTIYAASNLAVTYTKLGKLEKAEELQLRVLKVRRDSVGEHHLDTLVASTDLARTYVRQGKLAQAEKIFVENLEIYRDIVGESHPTAMDMLSHLAEVYRKQDKPQEEEQVLVKIHQLRLKSKGERHLDTIAASSALADMNYFLGRFQEAEKILTNALTVCQEVLGEQDPATIHIASNLATIYHEIGKQKEAEDMFTKVLQLRRKVLGEQHLTTLLTSINLALVYVLQARFKDALELTSHTLSIAKVILSEDHPSFARIVDVHMKVQEDFDKQNSLPSGGIQESTGSSTFGEARHEGHDLSGSSGQISLSSSSFVNIRISKEPNVIQKAS